MDEQAPTVVVVDDATEVRLLVRARLRISGFNVVGEGADGAEAVELASRLQPALMLLDVSMPGVDGLEALPAVLEGAPGTRVVLYSGFEEPGLARKAQHLGAADFVAKSAPLDTLVDRLWAVIGREHSRPAVGPGAAHEPDGPAQAADGALDPGVLQEHRERFQQ